MGQRGQYAIWGACFGVAFPLFATAFTLLSTDNGWGASAIASAYSDNPLLWIILSAPLFLGAFAALAGARQDQLNRALDGLEQRVAEKTRFLEEALADKEAALQELREAVRSAEAANNIKSHFLATMSHELRTPLNAIIGFGNVLAKNKDGTLSEKDLDRLERIRTNGRHLLELLDDILDVSQIEADRLELELEPVDLAAIIDDVLDTVTPVAESRGIAVVADRCEHFADYIPADRRRLRQVLSNLLSNAIKFSPDGAVVLIRTIADENNKPLRLDIVDWGPGIGPDEVEFVFEKFYQADNSMSRHHGGTGLGLTIALTLARKMGYDLDVISVVGEGTTFSIRFSDDAPELQHTPRDQQPRASRKHRSDPKDIERDLQLLNVDRNSGKLVLIIDDDSDARELIASFVEELGHQPLVASSGTEGLVLARRLVPDFITLDLMMPGMDGATTWRELQRDSRTRDIPVAIISVAARDAEIRPSGVTAVIEKPLDRSRLRHLLE